MSKFKLWQYVILVALLAVVVLWSKWYFLAFLLVFPVLAYMNRRNSEQ